MFEMNTESAYNLQLDTILNNFRLVLWKVYTFTAFGMDIEAPEFHY